MGGTPLNSWATPARRELAEVEAITLDLDELPKSRRKCTAVFRWTWCCLSLFSNDCEMIHPDAQFAKRVQELALNRGLILLLCGAYGNVIRFLFPLTTPEGVLTEGLAILESALREAASAKQ